MRLVASRNTEFTLHYAISSESAESVDYGEPVVSETRPAERAANIVLLTSVKQGGRQIVERAGRGPRTDVAVPHTEMMPLRMAYWTNSAVVLSPRASIM
jgi:hypothetical protein